MKITIQKQQLSEAVQFVSKAVSTKTTIPILTGIKIVTDRKGVTFTASDSDISIQYFVPVEKEDHVYVEIEREGSIVLPNRYFSEMVRKLPQDSVTITVEDRFSTMIQSGKAEFHLMGMDPEEFPRLPQIHEDRVFSIQSDLLKSMIRQTSFAVSTAETRPILTGILWSLQEGKLKFVATDSHRLAQREAMVEGSEELSFSNVVIPGKALNELGKIIHDNDQLIDIVVTDNQVLIKSGELLFYTRILDGTYPDTSRLIPHSGKVKMIVKTKSLLDSIERASLIAKDSLKNIVRLETKAADMIEISSNAPEIGKVSEEIVVDGLEGEELKIAFNAKFMIDALRAMDSESVEIQFTGAMSPFIIRPIEHPWVLQLILPIRTY